jgi:hypothetical protein
MLQTKQLPKLCHRNTIEHLYIRSHVLARDAHMCSDMLNSSRVGTGNKMAHVARCFFYALVSVGIRHRLAMPQCTRERNGTSFHDVLAAVGLSGIRSKMSEDQTGGVTFYDQRSAAAMWCVIHLRPSPDLRGSNL